MVSGLLFNKAYCKIQNLKRRSRVRGACDAPFRSGGPRAGRVSSDMAFLSQVGMLPALHQGVHKVRRGRALGGHRRNRINWSAGSARTRNDKASHHFGAAPEAQVIATELVHEPGVAARGSRSLVVAEGTGRFELDLLAAARIVVDLGHAVQAAAVFVQFDAVIGAVHHVVEVGHARGANLRQRDHGAAVVHRGRRQQGGDGDAAVSRVKMQLVAVSDHLVALRIALGAVLAGGMHLRQSPPALPRRRRFLGGGSLAAPGTAAASHFRRHRLRYRCSLLRAGQDRLTRLRHRRVLIAARRVLACVDGGAVAAKVSDQLISEVLPDQRLMDTFCEAIRRDSSQAREKPASEGSLRHSGKPQMWRSVRPIARRSLSRSMVVRPRTALATKALAGHARSHGGRQTPRQLGRVNSTMRAHSNMAMTRSNFGVSPPTSGFNSGSRPS